MSSPYVGEIRIFAFGFAPVGWALCNGQTLSIQQNQALFALIGVTYGGNGTTTFNLPDLQGRLPVGQGNGAGLSAYVIGEAGGAERVTLLSTQMPVHNHLVNATTTAGSNVASPQNAYLATPTASPRGTAVDPYSTASPPNVTLNANAVSTAGGSQPFSVLQPFLCLNFCIALVGSFPSRG
jgi:microcystin-dependent protein